MAYQKTTRVYPSRAPKRRIEKVWSQIQENFAAGITGSTLHTAEDSKTLVRIRARITCHGTAPGQGAAWTLAIRPAGTTIATANPAVGNDLDNDENDNVLLRDCQDLNDIGSGPNDVYEIDSKAMRKLQPGDEIRFAHISSAAAGKISAMFIMWFKE